MEERSVSKLIGFAGVLLVVGFFTQWLRGWGATVSGLDLARAASGWDRYALFIIPVGGAFMIFGALRSPIMARRAAFLTGIGILGYGVFSVARVVLAMFHDAAGYGLWMVFLGAVAAVVLPLVVKTKAKV